MRPAPSRLVLIGHPVRHSISPLVHTAALRAAGFPQEYVTLDVTPGDLARVMHELVHANAAGNVTIPHKRAVYDLCDVTTPLAKRVQAVNTFWVDDGKLYGDNTDVAGFDAAVQAVIDPGQHRREKRELYVTVLGAGGAASAVLTALSAWPATHVTIWNRTASNAELLVQSYDATRVEMDLAQAVRGADLVVNATALGLYDDDPFPVPIAYLAPHAAVFDLVYRPAETAWVLAARAAGHNAADGQDMLIQQGAVAFERWFGVAPDLNVMRQAVAR